MKAVPIDYTGVRLARGTFSIERIWIYFYGYTIEHPRKLRFTPTFSSLRGFQKQMGLVCCLLFAFAPPYSSLSMLMRIRSLNLGTTK
jgi:hypothetical protein